VLEKIFRAEMFRARRKAASLRRFDESGGGERGGLCIFSEGTIRRHEGKRKVHSQRESGERASGEKTCYQNILGTPARERFTEN